MSNRAKHQAILARIAKLQIEADKLKPLADAELDTTAVNAGDTIEFTYGRGDAATKRTGTVLGVSKPEGKGPTIVKVLSGEGVSTEVLSVFPSAITAVTPKAA
jgi:hypothetical protein